MGKADNDQADTQQQHDRREPWDLKIAQESAVFGHLYSLLGNVAFMIFSRPSKQLCLFEKELQT